MSNTLSFDKLPLRVQAVIEDQIIPRDGRSLSGHEKMQFCREYFKKHGEEKDLWAGIAKAHKIQVIKSADAKQAVEKFYCDLNKRDFKQIPAKIRRKNRLNEKHAFIVYKWIRIWQGLHKCDNEVLTTIFRYFTNNEMQAMHLVSKSLHAKLKTSLEEIQARQLHNVMLRAGISPYLPNAKEIFSKVVNEISNRLEAFCQICIEYEKGACDGPASFIECQNKIRKMRLDNMRHDIQYAELEAIAASKIRYPKYENLLLRIICGYSNRAMAAFIDPFKKLQEAEDKKQLSDQHVIYYVIYFFFCYSQIHYGYGLIELTPDRVLFNCLKNRFKTVLPANIKSLSNWSAFLHGYASVRGRFGGPGSSVADYLAVLNMLLPLVPPRACHLKIAARYYIQTNDSNHFLRMVEFLSPDEQDHWSNNPLQGMYGEELKGDIYETTVRKIFQLYHSQLSPSKKGDFDVEKRLKHLIEISLI